jgi:hypothetical protein
VSRLGDPLGFSAGSGLGAGVVSHGSVVQLASRSLALELFAPLSVLATPRRVRVSAHAGRSA